MEKEYNKIMSNEELRDFIKNEVLFASEVADLLHVTRQHVLNIVCQGKLVPVKKSRVGNLYLKKDVIEYKNNIRKTSLWDIEKERQDMLDKYIVHCVENNKKEDNIIKDLVEIFNVEEEKAKTMLSSIHRR